MYSKEEWLLIISIPIYALCIITEFFIGLKQRKELYDWKDSAISIWLGVTGAFLDIIIKVVTLGVLNWCNQHALFKPDLLTYYPILAWFLVFIGQDFCFYWLHRSEHYSRVLWAVHSNHHSSEKYNFTVALRSSVLQPLYRFAFYIPIAFLGFDGLTIMFMFAVNQFYQFFLHTETIGKLPKWYEAIFVTPSHHRVHHASNINYLDKNMGQVLIIWDKLFGTYQAESETPKYGLTTNLKTYNPLRVMFEEWIKIYKDLAKTGSLKQRVKYLIMPPGWSHDGSTKTSNQLRKELNKKR
ncbi:MAG: sterol desaturase family protein [Bacteroidetes bacterium]|nr:sterol desaturase family protein [Bacteroidota bacterium]